MTTKNFVVKNGITTGSITLDASTGNITGTNLSVTGITRLGAVGNVKITGGTSGQAIVTDGLGNLSFANSSSISSPAPMPTYVAVGDTITISANYQGIFGYPITVDGTIVVDGILVDANDATVPAGNINFVQYNNGNVMGGTSTFTFVAATGLLSVPSITATGNITGANIITNGVVKTTSLTVATLPAAATVGAGSRSFVTDSNTTTFLATVGSGGSNAVPVVSNGTVWIVG